MNIPIRQAYLALNDCFPRAIPAKVFDTLAEAKTARTPAGRYNRIIACQNPRHEWISVAQANQPGYWERSK